MIRSEKQLETRRESPPREPILDLSVVVVSWNTRELLARCLASVYETLDGSIDGMPHSATPTSFEVVVVDNGSTDGSVEMVREHFPGAKLVASSDNLGFARANNLALRDYRGRYALLLNPDTEARPGALQTLVSYLDEHPEVGAVGPRLLNPDGSLQQSCHPAPGLARELWRLFHGDAIHRYGMYAMDTWSVEAPRPVDVIQGACLMLRREALDQVGLLDEEFYIYSEEVDLCQRIRQGGWKIAWVPAAEVVHFGGQSTRQVAEAMFLQLYRSKILYFRKHRGRAAAWIYKLILLLASASRLAFGPLADLRHPGEREEHRTLARYYRRLIGALPGM